MADRDSALARLGQLHREGILADLEVAVAREAMGGATQPASTGRAIRAEVYERLGPMAGSPFILMDVLTKARLCKYDWTRLALQLDAEELRDRLLGLPYESAPERWNDLLTKLELLGRMAKAEKLLREQVAGVKYPLLGRLDWLKLVGELAWLSRDWDGLELWCREDGWMVTDEDVIDTIRWLQRLTPYEDSPVNGQRIHHYYDWIDDQCWRHYNSIIADGDAGYLRYMGLRRPDDDYWTFCW